MFSTKNQCSAPIIGEKSQDKPCKRETVNILLLQGPVGPFFKDLQEFLEEEAFEVWRICFHAGDSLFSKKKNRIPFSGELNEWESWLREFLVGAKINHMILFGSGRPIHCAARRVASQLSISVISLEEGYIRPGYITVESGGNNGDSPRAGLLPPKGYNESLPGDGRSENFQGFCWMSLYGALYYAIRNIFSSHQQRKLFHRRFSIFPEAFYWIRNVFRRITFQATELSKVQNLLEYYDKRYFLIPLQVSSDMQMGTPARGWNSVRLISSVLRSFAAHAPEDHRLVFKIHPLERGHDNNKAFIYQTAAALGLQQRVDVVDIGSLGLLTRHSAGMITINSTSGLSAIFHGVPLLVFGEALYANKELATCARSPSNLDAFWTKGFVANAQLRKSYINWIKASALKPGDFYNKKGIKLACRGVLEKVQELGKTLNKKNKDISC